MTEVESLRALTTEQMRREGESAVKILTSNARHLYWTPAQMVAHHTVNGCNLRAGDLIGTGTISGPHDQELSSMLELTSAGTRRCQTEKSAASWQMVKR